MKDLAIAYAVQRKKKMASGGMVRPMSGMKSSMMDPKSMVSKIMAKKMNKGGMVDNESMPIDHDTIHDDFLSAEDDLSAHELSELDSEKPVDDEHEIEGMGEEREAMKRRGMISMIMSKMR